MTHTRDGIEMMNRSRRLSAAAALWLALLAACSGGDADTPAENVEGDGTVMVLQASDLATVREDAIAQGVVLSGTLNPAQIAEVRAQVPGMVSSIRADRGDAVRAGQVMAVLDAQGIRSGAAGARAQVAAAQANLALANQRYESARTLYEAGAMSRIDFQTAEAGLESARAQLAAAQAQAAGASESARQATITAPFAGEVSARNVNVGEAVNPGQPLFTVVNASTLELNGQIPVQDAGRVARGQTVEFTLDAYPGRVFKGVVERIEPVADPATRRVGVYLRLANPERSLVGGLFATGRIITGASDDVLVIPASAVRTDGGATYVWVVEDGTLQRQPVTIGGQDVARGIVSVASGLEAGQQVLIAPGGAEAGTRVRIETEAEGGSGAEAEGAGARDGGQRPEGAGQ